MVINEFPSSATCAIAFVGEAPGEEEVARGRPLVGPSGRCFEAMLRSANINRADCFVGNVFLDKAEDNDCGEWIQDPQVWEPACARLHNELKDCSPNVIVALGGTALKALTGEDKISAARGGFIPHAICKVLPTFHPAAVLRDWRLYSVVIGDFIKADTNSESPTIVYPRRELLLEPDLVDLAEWFPKLTETDLLSVDIETGWGFITCIGFAPNAEEAICVPFVDLRRPNRNYWPTVETEAEAWWFIHEVMEHPVPKLGQNFGAYDIMWFLRMGIKPVNYREDTRLLHHALYPELPKSLAFMGASYGSQGAWKHWGHRKVEKGDA